MSDDFKISDLCYHEFFETAQSGILLIDFKTGIILDANKFFINLIGYSKNSLLGKYLWKTDIFRNFVIPKEIFKIIKEKNIIHFDDLLLKTKTGEKINVELTANVCEIDEKKFIQFSIHDISRYLRAEKLLRENEIILRQLFENMSSGVAVYRVKNNGKDFILKNFNRSAEKIENIKRENIIEKNVLDIFPGVKKIGLYKVFQRVWKTGKPETHPISFYKDKRISGWRENFIYKLPNGDIVAIYNDVTERKKSEEKIRWLASYPILNPLPIVEIDKKEGIIYINPSAQKLFPDLNNKTIDHPLVEGWVKHFSKTIKEREIKVNNQWYSETFHLVNPNRLRIYANNITELKNFEEKISELNNRNEAIIESIGDGIFACDKNGYILVFNKVAEEMTGIMAKKAIGNHYSKIISFVREGNGKFTSDFITEAINNNKITKMDNHIFLVRKDGHKIPVANSAAPIKNIDGKIIGCVVVFHDMTREYEIDKSKTEFVALASHQMRTPLTGINWYTEALQSKQYGSLNNKQSEFATEIENASKRMTFLVGSLLNVSRLEMGTFAIKPISVNIIKLAKNVINIFKHKINEKKLLFQEKYSSNINLFLGDPDLLEMIFQNLITNAVKYTPSGGKIIFSIKKEKKNIKIIVSDTGIGIPQSQQYKIFEKLFRADNVKTIDSTGTGLGLYIVHEIIIHSGGKIWFESKEGQGTTFYITFPLTGMTKKEGEKKIIK